MHLLKTIALFSFITICAIGLNAQEFQQITAAVKSGNASALATKLDNNVDITIVDSDGTYSKGQAQMVLKNFFDKNKPIDFKLMHKGDSGGGSKYIIGSLKTNKGMFRTYIYVKGMGSSVKIQEIRFERN